MLEFLAISILECSVMPNTFKRLERVDFIFNRRTEGALGGLGSLSKG